MSCLRYDPAGFLTPQIFSVFALSLLALVSAGIHLQFVPGHFVPLEDPKPLAEDMRAFFKTFKK
jgi:hypothetical protein